MKKIIILIFLLSLHTIGAMDKDLFLAQGLNQIDYRTGFKDLDKWYVASDELTSDDEEFYNDYGIERPSIKRLHDNGSFDFYGYDDLGFPRTEYKYWSRLQQNFGSNQLLPVNHTLSHQVPDQSFAMYSLNDYTTLIKLDSLLVYKNETNNTFLPYATICPVRDCGTAVYGSSPIVVMSALRSHYGAHRNKYTTKKGDDIFCAIKKADMVANKNKLFFKKTKRT